MAYWDELDRAQPAPAEPNLWPDGSRAPLQITVRPRGMYDDLVDPNNIGMSEADTGGWGSTWDKLKGGMFAQLLAEPFRKGAGLLGAVQDYSANEYPGTYGVTGQTTDYDPRREAASYAAGTGMNVIGLPAFTGGVPASALGSAARNPLYHGSERTNLHYLNPSERGPLGPGVYSSEAKQIAGSYAGPEGRIYELPQAERDIYMGVGHRTDAEWAGFKADKQRLIDAADPDKKKAVSDVLDKMWSGDGYPTYQRIRAIYGDDAKAQELYRKAGFEGISGQVDGPETVLFGPRSQPVLGSNFTDKRTGATILAANSLDDAKAAQANKMLYGGTHSPDTPSGNYMVRYTKEGAPELVDLTTEGGRQHHGFSTLRTGLPVDEMSFNIKGAPDLERNVWNIEDLQKRNAALQFGVSDPTVGGGKLVKVGDTKLDNPVAMEGGLNYSLLHADKPVPGLPDAQRLFANQKGPVTGILNEAREWADKGYDPIFTSMMLAKTSGDQAKQTARTAYRVMRQAEPDKDIVALIDKAMAQQSKDIKGAPPRPYPGFASKDMEKWLEDVGGPYRAAFVKALDTSPVLKGTGADMGQVRFANTDKRLRSTPTGASGLFMGGIKPELGAIDKSLNSTYPSAFLAQKGDIGGLQGNVPFHTIAPDLWRGLMKSGDPKIFANVPAYYMARGMPNNLGKVQPVTQEVVDNVSEFFRRNPKGWALAGGIPAGVAASLMASDQAEAAPVNMWGRQ